MAVLRARRAVNRSERMGFMVRLGAWLRGVRAMNHNILIYARKCGERSGEHWFGPFNRPIHETPETGLYSFGGRGVGWPQEDAGNAKTFNRGFRG